MKKKRRRKSSEKSEWKRTAIIIVVAFIMLVMGYFAGLLHGLLHFASWSPWNSNNSYVPELIPAAGFKREATPVFDRVETFAATAKGTGARGSTGSKQARARIKTVSKKKSSKKHSKKKSVGGVTDL